MLMPDLSAVTSFLEPAFPPELSFLPPAVLAILGVAAAVDAFTGRVPNLLIVLALGGAFFFSANHEGWGTVAQRSLIAAGALFILVLVSGLYKALAHRDPFGMGDAKWTAVAAFAFGLPNLCWAWVIAAWLGLLWLGGRKLLSLIWWQLKPEDGFIHFAPFLLIGVIVKVYVLG